MSSKLPDGILLRVATVAVAVLVACSPMHAVRAGGDGSSSRPAATQGTPSRPGVYVVTFGVTTRSGRLSAVQFEATLGQKRAWKTVEGKVACRNVSRAAMHACNDKGGGTLACALIDLTGINTPSDLVSCEVESGTRVSASELNIEVIDASDPQNKPAKIDVAVTSVRGG